MARVLHKTNFVFRYINNIVLKHHHIMVVGSCKSSNNYSPLLLLAMPLLAIVNNEVKIHTLTIAIGGGHSSSDLVDGYPCCAMHIVVRSEDKKTF